MSNIVVPELGESVVEATVGRWLKNEGDHVEAGETIVSSGAFKLRNGSAVAVNNLLAPDVEIAPRPADR